MHGTDGNSDKNLIERAIIKALKSGDTELVYTVLLYMKQNLDREEFYSLLEKHNKAFKLWIRFCKLEKNEDELIRIYDQENRVDKIARLKVENAYSAGQIDIRTLEDGLGIYKSSSDQFMTKAVGSQISLLHEQEALEQRVPVEDGFVGYSLSKTLYTLIKNDLESKASALKDKYNVPPKRYYWIKIRALADSDNWEKLEDFSKQKNPPIGYKPFAEVCIKRKNNQEAIKYIKKIKEPHPRAMLYARIDEWDAAIGLAQSVKGRDRDTILDDLRKKCRNQNYVQIIDDLMNN